jgi:hypothetical protein
MDIFKNEETRVAEKFDLVIPQLEDVAQRGQIIADNIHRVRNALTFPKSGGHSLFGSQIPREDIEEKLENIKNELDGYATKSKAVIDHVTKILTEIRYNPTYIPG